MSSRTEHYLKQLLIYPTKPVIITKNRKLKTTKAMFSERGRVLKEIKTALDLMGITYRVSGMKITLIQR